MKNLYIICLIFTFNTIAQVVYSDSLAVYSIKHKEGIVTIEGKIWKRPTNEVHYSFLGGNELLPVSKETNYKKSRNKVFWYEDRTGKKLIKVECHLAQSFSDNLAQITLANSTVGFINTSGKLVIPYSDGFDLFSSYYSSGRILKEEEYKYGYIDSNNILKVPFLYEKAEAFHNGTAIVGNMSDDDQRMLYGLINPNGDTLIPFDYVNLRREKENVFVAEYFSQTVKDSVWELSWKTGVVDQNNKTLIPFQYDSIKLEWRHYLHDENYLLCNKRETGWRIVEIGTGRETSCCYEEVRKMKYGYVPVMKQSWGLVDSVGNLKIPYRFRDIKVASRSVARVRKGHKWSYWKTDGTQMTDFIYDETSEFRFGYTYARSGTQTFLLDSNLNVVLSGFPEEYESGDAIHPVQGPNTLLFLKQGKYGLMNMKGEIIFPAISDDPILFRPEWSEDKPW